MGSRTIVVALGLVFLVQGCCGECLPPSGTPPASKPAFVGSTQTPLEMSEANIRENASRHFSHAAVDPVTAIVIRSALDDALNKLQTLLNNATADIKAVGESLESDGHALLADFDARFQNDLDLTYDKINHEQRELWNAAASLTDRVNFAAQQLEANTLQGAKVALWEADIVAYDGIKNLPCEVRESRVLYASSFNNNSPLSLRLGIDLPDVKVRGNFLCYGDPDLKIEGVRAHVKSASSTEIVSEIPKQVIDKIQAQGGGPMSISASPPSCVPHWFNRSEINPGRQQSVSLSVLPAVSYEIYAIMRPFAEVPSPMWWPLEFYRSDEDCDAHYRIDQNNCLPPDPSLKLIPEPQPYKIVITTANCGSGLDTASVKGDKCVFVPGHLDGCGIGPWPIHDCKGRGWIGYHIDLHYYGFVTSALGDQEWKNSVGYGDYNIPYIHSIPQGARNFHWPYVVKVIVHEGPNAHTVTLTNDVQNAEGIETHFDEIGRQLHIKVPKPRKR